MNSEAEKQEYIGRFAPSPTGPLHLGSLYTALASFLHARANQGKWLLRIDDSDTYRNIANATESIIKTLSAYGLHWDDKVNYQHENIEHYQSTISQLINKHHAYPCICSRKTLNSSLFKTYQKTCLGSILDAQQPHALRILCSEIDITFEDQLQGRQTHQLAEQYGDFIVKRKDSIIAYQLAVVIDDQLQNINHVIRGFDLLDSTPKQIYLQQILGYQTPQYCHVPIITELNGQKLSKQNLAQAISTKHPEKTLFILLEMLSQSPPHQLENASVNEIISWAIEHWNATPLKKVRAINTRID